MQIYHQTINISSKSSLHTNAKFEEDFAYVRLPQHIFPTETESPDFVMQYPKGLGLARYSNF